MTAMSWREERDALIAQTLAFVQSVTGKPADFAQLGTSQSEVPDSPGHEMPQSEVPALFAIESHASSAPLAGVPAQANADDAVPHEAAARGPKTDIRTDTSHDTRAEILDATAFEVMRAEAAMIDAAMRLVSNKQTPARTKEPVAPQPARPSRESSRESSPNREAGAPPAESKPTAALPVNGHAALQQVEFSGEHFTSITSEMGLQRDMQAEIKARVATFRANQERFNRERQEYFSSTLAKLRASINDTPPSDK